MLELTGVVWWYHVETQEGAAFRQTGCRLPTDCVRPFDRQAAASRQTRHGH